jgi:hypothetical protein
MSVLLSDAKFFQNSQKAVPTARGLSTGRKLSDNAGKTLLEQTHTFAPERSRNGSLAEY